MMNEVEKHLKRFAPGDEVPCPHPQCKATGLVLCNYGLQESYGDGTQDFCACRSY